MARDLGVDLAGLTGTGPNGSITRDDVQRAAARRRPSPFPSKVRGPATARRAARSGSPIRGVRKHTAAAMAASAFTAPHVTEFLQIDITETMTATARLRTLPEFADVRVSPLLLVARALLVAAARHPMINSSWDEAAQEIVVKHYVNLGIAAATDRGLVVPNVKDAHALTLPQLAGGTGAARGDRTGREGHAGRPVAAARSRSPTSASSESTPARRSCRRARPRSWRSARSRTLRGWSTAQLAVRKVCTLALSFDHRIVDGDLGSAVLRDVGAMLTDPLRDAGLVLARQSLPTEGPMIRHVVAVHLGRRR